MISPHPAQRPHRRLVLLGLPVLLSAAGCAAAAQVRPLTVYKTRDCTCCLGWVAHMERAGFKPTVVPLEDLTPIRKRLGIPFELSSCHTGVVGGYVVEGHVPSGDVVRLLQEKPKALGLLAPGMPFGAPGMEGPNGEREAFRTLLLLDRSGRTRVFGEHR